MKNVKKFIIINGRKYYLTTVINRLYYFIRLIANSPISNKLQHINIRNDNLIKMFKINWYGDKGARRFFLENDFCSLVTPGDQKTKCDLFSIKIGNVFSFLKALYLKLGIAFEHLEFRKIMKRISYLNNQSFNSFCDAYYRKDKIEDRELNCPYNDYRIYFTEIDESIIQDEELPQLKQEVMKAYNLDLPFVSIDTTARPRRIRL